MMLVDMVWSADQDSSLVDVAMKFLERSWCFYSSRAKKVRNIMAAKKTKQTKPPTLPEATRYQ
jgi:hypothetical protein